MGVSANWNTESIGETGLKLHEAYGKLTIEAGLKSSIINVPNVVGMLEGSDPDLKHEHIGIGSHLDHMGKRGDTIYYGADDDGSGSTAVLLTAEALVKSDVKPKRSIVFMCFAAEEIGLVGSRYYTENPLLPLDDMVCLLQMDMVGRNEETADEPASENVETIHLVGSKRISMDLHGLTISSNRHLGFEFEYDQESVYSRSDHANFARKGVPITFLFSGFHPDYHQPTDTIEKINFEKLTNSAKLNYLVAIQAANRPERLKKDAAGG
jgi:Zn-dependent M28 family amino/carboxypeptidase